MVNRPDTRVSPHTTGINKIPMQLNPRVNQSVCFFEMRPLEVPVAALRNRGSQYVDEQKGFSSGGPNINGVQAEEAL